MIRPATLSDLPALLVLGEAMHAESPRFSRLRFDPARLEATLRHVCTSPDGFLWVGLDQRDEVVGGMAAMVVQHWCSTDLIATDLALFMKPAARGSTIPARLVRCYLGWARSQGAKLTQCGVTTGVDTENTARLYERLGMTRCGVILEA